MAGSRSQPKGTGEYAREAFAEWGKAARYGARALAPTVREAASAATAYAADTALAKFGPGGKLASKLSMGSRIIERIRGANGAGEGSEDGEASPGRRSEDREAAASNGNGFKDQLPIPIVESIEVAVPVEAVYDLCTRFESYPEFLERVESVETADDSNLTFIAKARGRQRELEVEITNRHPNQRLDWRCTEGVKHTGVISFHELAPRLTHIELAVELEPEGIVERLTRSARLSGRAIRAEMDRFKAHAELWEEPELEDAPEAELEDEEEIEDEEELEDEPEAEEDEDFEDEALEDEGDLEDEEEFDEAEEEDFEDEDLEEEERLDPARAWR